MGFVADKKGEASFDPALFERLAEAEDHHFWFRARNRMITHLVSRLAEDFPPDYRVMEVGCGNGNVLRFLKQACPHGLVVGMDLYGEGFPQARRRTSASLVRGDMHAPPFGAPFHLVALFDVLEHLPDDRRVLRDLHTLLAPGGRLLLTVPAHMSLWSYWDEAAHHQRRYVRRDLREKLEACGFEIEYLTEFMATLFPLAWVARRVAPLLSSRRKGDDEHALDDEYYLVENELKVRPLANMLIGVPLALETALVKRRWTLPIGTSILALARRSSG